jgi:hypothetical protein
MGGGINVIKTDNDGDGPKTHLFNRKLLVGLDLDLSGLLPGLLRDERDLIVSLIDEKEEGASCRDSPKER